MMIAQQSQQPATSTAIQVEQPSVASALASLNAFNPSLNASLNAEGLSLSLKPFSVCVTVTGMVVTIAEQVSNSRDAAKTLIKFALELRQQSCASPKSQMPGRQSPHSECMHHNISLQTQPKVQAPLISPSNLVRKSSLGKRKPHHQEQENQENRSDCHNFITRTAQLVQAKKMRPSSSQCRGRHDVCLSLTPFSICVN